jgi:hypothetical protein
MNTFEQTPVSIPSKENLKYIEETERKKQIKRENRLKNIVEKNSKLLETLFPEKAKEFEIVCEEIRETKSSIFEGEMTRFQPSDLPTYGIFLEARSNPENKYLIMYWTRPDLDAKKANFEMAITQSFADNIKKGVNELSQ